MIDIKLLRENPGHFKKSADAKHVVVDIAHILEIDEKFRQLSQGVQTLREQRNLLVGAIKGKPTEEQIAKGKELKERLEKEEHALAAVSEELQRDLAKIPNPIKPDVKVG